MKTKSFFSVMAFTTGMCVMTSCGSTKQVVQSAQSASVVNPYANLIDSGVEDYDTDEYYTATGIEFGSRKTEGEIRIRSLQNAQTQLRMKIKSVIVDGLMTEFAKTYQSNEEIDAVNKIARYAEVEIEKEIKETRATKIRVTPVDEKGDIGVYTVTRIYKNDLAKKIADRVSEDKQLKIDFGEKQLRELMEKRSGK